LPAHLEISVAIADFSRQIRAVSASRILADIDPL